MDVFFVIVLIVLVSVLGMLSIPLSQYIVSIEDNVNCDKCRERECCFAKKPFFIGENNWVDEFMLFSFWKVRKYCNYATGDYKKKFIIYS
jgi:hypothetical protein